MPETCQDLVREHDRDRYLATLFAPIDKQSHLFALFAFNCEVMRVPHIVTEPQLGEIRLQWWIETLHSIAQGKSQQSPVAAALATTILKFGLPVEPLISLVNAHIFDVYADQMPNRNDLEGYLGETSSVMFHLAAIILDSTTAPEYSEQAGLGGVAFGIARLRGDKFMPKGESRKTLQALAKKRLQEFAKKPLPPSLLPAFLPVALIPMYLSAAPHPPPLWQRQLRLWWAARTEKVA